MREKPASEIASTRFRRHKFHNRIARFVFKAAVVIVRHRDGSVHYQAPAGPFITRNSVELQEVTKKMAGLQEEKEKSQEVPHTPPHAAQGMR